MSISMLRPWIFLFFTFNICDVNGTQKRPKGPIHVQFRTHDLKTSLLWSPRPEWPNRDVEYQVETCNSRCERKDRWTEAKYCRKLSDNEPMVCALHTLSETFFGYGRVRALFRPDEGNSSFGECTCSSCKCTKFIRTNTYSAELQTSLSAPSVKVLEPKRPTSAIVEVKLSSKQVVCHFGGVDGTVSASVMEDMSSDCDGEVSINKSSIAAETTFRVDAPDKPGCGNVSTGTLVELRNLLPNTRYCVSARYSEFAATSAVAFEVFETSSDDDTVPVTVIVVGCILALVVFVATIAALALMYLKCRSYVKAAIPDFLKDALPDTEVGQRFDHTVNPVYTPIEETAQLQEYITSATQIQMNVDWNSTECETNRSSAMTSDDVIIEPWNTGSCSHAYARQAINTSDHLTSLLSTAPGSYQSK